MQQGLYRVSTFSNFVQPELDVGEFFASMRCVEIPEFKCLEMMDDTCLQYYGQSGIRLSLK